MVDVQPLSTKQQTAFIDLRRLANTELWAQPTICPGWNVKDIAAHMLGDRIARVQAPGGYPPLHPRENEAFPAFLDRINDDWVTAARSISPTSPSARSRRHLWSSHPAQPGGHGRHTTMDHAQHLIRQTLPEHRVGDG